MKQKKKGFNEFKKGFLKNSLLIIIVSLIIAIGVIFMMEAFIKNNGLLNIELSKFLSNEKDYYSYTSYRVYEEKVNKTENHRLYIVGGSSLREAIETEEIMEERLKDKYTNEYEVVLLSIQGLKSLEQLLILENLPNRNGTIILADNPRSLFLYHTKKYLILKGRMHTNYINSTKELKDIGAVDGKFNDFLSGFLIKKAFDKILLANTTNRINSEFEIQPHHFDVTNDGYHEIPEEKILSEIERQSKSTEEYQYLYKKTMGLIFDLAKKKDINVVLLNLPYNTKVLKGYADKEESATQVFRRIRYELAEKYDNVILLNFEKDLDLEIYDFYDVTHIISQKGRDLYTNSLVEELDAVLE